jgi:hypothetical protein
MRNVLGYLLALAATALGEAIYLHAKPIAFGIYLTFLLVLSVPSLRDRVKRSR